MDLVGHHPNTVYADRVGASRLGQATTPIECVECICYLASYNTDHNLHDPNVIIIDPFAGTGVFMDYIMYYYFDKEDLIAKWDNGSLACYEYCPDVALLCAVNMELRYMAVVGEYRRCNFVACIDTFEVDPKTGNYNDDGEIITNDQMWERYRV